MTRETLPPFRINTNFVAKPEKKEFRSKTPTSKSEFEAELDKRLKRNKKLKQGFDRKLAVD